MTDSVHYILHVLRMKCTNWLKTIYHATQSQCALTARSLTGCGLRNRRVLTIIIFHFAFCFDNDAIALQWVRSCIRRSHTHTNDIRWMDAHCTSEQGKNVWQGIKSNNGTARAESIIEGKNGLLCRASVSLVPLPLHLDTYTCLFCLSPNVADDRHSLALSLVREVHAHQNGIPTQ